jgi:hypothetical protein
MRPADGIHIPLDTVDEQVDARLGAGRRRGSPVVADEVYR